MKQFTAILFVLLYLVAMLKPIAPFVEYAINYDYISKVLCINKDKPEMSCKGTCQLMKKLQEKQDDDYKALRISMDEYPIGFVKILKIASKNNDDSHQKKHHYYKENYGYLYSYNCFHPPIS